MAPWGGHIAQKISSNLVWTYGFLCKFLCKGPRLIVFPLRGIHGVSSSCAFEWLKPHWRALAVGTLRGGGVLCAHRFAGRSRAGPCRRIAFPRTHDVQGDAAAVGPRRQS